MAMKSKTIHGHAFEISQPYEPGHVLTEAEARALNQVRSENIGNNLRDKIKELIEAGDLTGAASLVAEKDGSYEFTLASVAASAKRDPIESEARKIARELVKNSLAESGRKLTVTPEGETDDSWADKIEGEVARIAALEEVLKVAKKNVADKQKRSESLMQSAGVSL